MPVEVHLANEIKTPDIKDIQKTVTQALRDTDQVLLAKAQLEVSMAMLTYIQAMDWKLWEMYSRLTKEK